MRMISAVFLPNRPLWLSPCQVMLVPVNPSCEEYAKKVSLKDLIAYFLKSVFT